MSAVVVTLAAACGTDGGTEATAESSGEPSTATPTTTASPITSPPSATPTQEVPAFPKDTSPQTRRSSGKAELVFTGVDVAQHDGFDRIVLEFSGTGTPGWAVDYVDRPQLDGSGDLVDLGGDSYLDIYASDTAWPAPGYYDGPRQFEPSSGRAVDDVYVGGTFEGTTQVLAGMDGVRAPFRVFVLTAPSRLVIDVMDQS